MSDHKPSPPAAVIKLDPDARARASSSAELLDSHSERSALCNQLEAIADDLPTPSVARCRIACEALEAHLSQYRGRRDAYRSVIALHPDVLALMQSFGDEDEGTAFEVAHAMEPLVRGEAPPDPETLGYMLRCLFTNVRRSMLIEKLAVMVARQP